MRAMLTPVFTATPPPASRQMALLYAAYAVELTSLILARIAHAAIIYATMPSRHTLRDNIDATLTAPRQMIIRITRFMPRRVIAFADAAPLVSQKAPDCFIYGDALLYAIIWHENGNMNS